jgi:hypothetical protein
MIMLDMNNHLRASRVFNQTRPLADLLDAVPKAPPHTHLQWRQLAELNAGVDQKHAIKRLLARSPAVSPSLGVSAEVLLASSTAQHSTVSA